MGFTAHACNLQIVDFKELKLQKKSTYMSVVYVDFKTDHMQCVLLYINSEIISFVKSFVSLLFLLSLKYSNISQYGLFE
jgi:hypothetical protein